MIERSDPRFLETAQAIVALGGQLHRRGWSPATSGNHSVRLGPNACAITDSGRDKGQLSVADILVVDLDGRPQGGDRPSAETLLHTSLYRAREGIGAVLHTHCAAATVVGLRHAGADAFALEGYEVLKGFAGVDSHETPVRLPLFDNSQDIAALAAEVGHDWGRAHGAHPLT